MELTVLVALVSRYGRLILPDLGAFLVSDFESGYSVANVTFSPFLRYNDGKFEQYLESDYAQTKAQARQSVQLFVSEIRQTLEQSGRCTIPDLGELRRDAQGQISFFPQGGDQAPAPQTEGTAVAPPVADERPAFDIPLIDEVVVAPPLPDGEYTISDGQFGATTPTPLESPSAASSIHDEGAFSLDGAIVEVNQHDASTVDTLSPLEIHFVEEEEAAQGGDALVTLEPSSQESGFLVDDCISAYQAYQAAAVPPPLESSLEPSIEPSIEPPIEHVEEGAPLASDPSETTLGEEASGEEPASLQMETPSLVEVEAQEASKEEAPQEAQVDNQENSQEVAKEDSQAPQVKPSRAGRTTPRAGAKDTPWVAPHTVVRKERSYKGVMWTAIAIVFLSLVVIDWLWLQQVTPRVVALLEEQGVLLRQHPSVDVSPQDAAKLASVNPQAPSQVPPVTPPSANTTVGELEKEWQRRVENGEGSVPTQTVTPQANHTPTAAPTPADNHRANTTEATAPAMPPTTASAFHVVLGCFRDVDNADAYAKKLKRSGFQTRVLAQNTGMHAVVVGSYTTRREASLVLNDIRGRYPEAWVLEK